MDVPTSFPYDSCAENSLSPSARVRESAKHVANKWKSVVFHTEAIAELAKSLAKEAISDNMGLERWKMQELHPKKADQFSIDWIFFVDTLNFSFWSEIEDSSSPEKFAVQYNGKLWTGYWALCAAVNRAIDEGIPILNADYQTKLTEADVAYLFRTSTKGAMPMLKERTENVRQSGEILLKKYGGSFVNCVQAANFSAQRLIETVLRDFPSYRDETMYRGMKVCFYKRAQILAADIWACFEGRGLGKFDDINELTIFADYRVPQVLNFFGTVKYGCDLQSKLESDFVFQYGDEEEVEIRAASVLVVDGIGPYCMTVLMYASVYLGFDQSLGQLLCARLKEILRDESPQRISAINAVVLDHYLWDYRQSHNREMAKTPYHKVRCIFY